MGAQALFPGKYQNGYLHSIRDILFIYQALLSTEAQRGFSTLFSVLGCYTGSESL